MSELLTFLPLVVIVIATVFLVRAIRQREAAGQPVPDRMIGIFTAIAGVILLVLLATSWVGLLIALTLLGISAFAWYRHFRECEGRMTED